MANWGAALRFLTGAVAKAVNDLFGPLKQVDTI
jgi:hypothetical protein